MLGTGGALSLFLFTRQQGLPLRKWCLGLVGRGARLRGNVKMKASREDLGGGERRARLTNYISKPRPASSADHAAETRRCWGRTTPALGRQGWRSVCSPVAPPGHRPGPQTSQAPREGWRWGRAATGPSAPATGSPWGRHRRRRRGELGRCREGQSPRLKRVHPRGQAQAAMDTPRPDPETSPRASEEPSPS